MNSVFSVTCAANSYSEPDDSDVGVVTGVDRQAAMLICQLWQMSGPTLQSGVEDSPTGQLGFAFTTEEPQPKYRLSSALSDDESTLRRPKQWGVRPGPVHLPTASSDSSSLGSADSDREVSKAEEAFHHSVALFLGRTYSGKSLSQVVGRCHICRTVLKAELEGAMLPPDKAGRLNKRWTPAEIALIYAVNEMWGEWRLGVNRHVKAAMPSKPVARLHILSSHGHHRSEHSVHKIVTRLRQDFAHQSPATRTLLRKVRALRDSSD